MCKRRSLNAALLIMLMAAPTCRAAPAVLTRPDIDVLYRTPPTPVQCCGTDALYVVLQVAGSPAVRLAELERLAPMGARGISMAQLVEAARAVGVQVAALQLPPGRLSSLPTPAVCHVNGNHYVAVLSVEGGRVQVFDNALGLLDCSEEAFDKRYQWDGLFLAVGSPMRWWWRCLIPAALGFLCLALGLALISSSRRRPRPVPIPASGEEL